MSALSALPVAQKLAFTLNRFFNIFAYTVSGFAESVQNVRRHVITVVI